MGIGDNVMVWEWEAQLMYRVWIVMPDGKEYVYGTYNDRHQANEIAMQVRDERGVQTDVEVLSI